MNNYRGSKILELARERNRKLIVDKQIKIPAEIKQTDSTLSVRDSLQFIPVESDGGSKVTRWLNAQVLSPEVFGEDTHQVSFIDSHNIQKDQLGERHEQLTSTHLQDQLDNAELGTCDELPG